MLFRVVEAAGGAGGGAAGEAGLESEFCLVEKWRGIERPLAPAARVLRVWLAWGEDKSEVRLVVKRAAAAVPAAATVRRKRSRAVKEGRRVGDTLHPRSLQQDRERCRDSIQKLMRIIIAQGNTIQTQLSGLKEKEEAIDSFEDRMHQLRVAESGRDYLLHTYLDQVLQISLNKVHFGSNFLFSSKISI